MRVSSTVIALGVVSLLTDLSSEMIYPLLPVFLTSVLNAGAFSIGVIEAVAEMTASLLKVFSGYLADRSKRRKPLVVVGYTLSSLMRPLIGIASTWLQVLSFRFVDRIGKGIRTSPRDALIADVTKAEVTGRAFGVHRAMDHAGAVLGPLVAVLLLEGMGLDLRNVFIMAAIPGAMVILTLIFFVREANTAPEGVEMKGQGAAGPLNRDFLVFLAGVGLFTLGNSSDAFLLLRLHGAGVEASGIALLWSALHLVKMLCSYIGGRASDRVGKKRMLITGWLYYAMVYLLMALPVDKTQMVLVFLSYGVYFGLTEPVERAWVSQIVPPEARGRAYGLYHATVGFCLLPASLLFGYIWQRWGYEYAFLTGAALAVLGSGVILMVREWRST